MMSIEMKEGTKKIIKIIIIIKVAITKSIKKKNKLS